MQQNIEVKEQSQNLFPVAVEKELLNFISEQGKNKENSQTLLNMLSSLKTLLLGQRTATTYAELKAMLSSFKEKYPELTLIRKIILLVQLLWNITFLRQMITTGEYGAAKLPYCSEDQRRQILQPIITNCLELCQALRENSLSGEIKLSDEKFEAIVTYAISETEKTLIDNRYPHEAVWSAVVAIRNIGLDSRDAKPIVKSLSAFIVSTCNAAIVTSYIALLDDLNRISKVAIPLQPREAYENAIKKIKHSCKQALHNREAMSREAIAEKEELLRIILLIEVVRHIALLTSLIETGEYQDSSGRSHQLDEAKRTMFRLLVDNYLGLYIVLCDALKNGHTAHAAIKLSHKNFELIASYAINEAQEMLKNPDRSPGEIVKAWQTLNDNLGTSPPPECSGEFVYLLAGLAFGFLGGGLAGVVAGFLCGGIFGMLPGFAVGAFVGAVVGGFIATQVHEAQEWAPYNLAQKALGANICYQKVQTLFFKKPNASLVQQHCSQDFALLNPGYNLSYRGVGVA
jgi:hypothetical protein